MTRTAVPILFAVIAALAIAAVQRAVSSDAERPEIVDFHAFHLAGTTALKGKFAESYDVPAMRARQRSLGGGKDVFMPFVYPPSFGLVLAPLALFPVGVAFALFTAATLGFYLLVLRRIAGQWVWHAVLAISPAMIINIRLGQNGFLTAGLAGLAAEWLAMRRDARAGVLTGLLAFKPQIATMLPLLFALRRSWRGVAVAAATAIGLTGSAVLILGRETVPAFLSSTAVVADFMAAGTFPLYRMTSVYAFALSLHAPAALALAIHCCVALLVVIAATVTADRVGGQPLPRSRSDVRTAGGIMLMATAFVSPYFFDYDLTVFGVGLAMVLPAMAHRMPARGLAALLAATAGVAATGLWCNALVAFQGTACLSVGGPALLACFGVVLAVLSRSTQVGQGSYAAG